MNSLRIILILTLFVSCKIKHTTKTSEEEKKSTEPKIVNGLIQDCPDILVINAMPGDKPRSLKESQYYIYKGFRKEISDFDSVWVKAHCNVKVTVAN